MATSLFSNEECESPLLARYKPLTYTAIITQRPTLEVRLDPICSRSCITRWTLGEHFPNLLAKTYPNRPPSRSLFEGSTPVKGYDCVTISLELLDVEAKRVKIEVQLRICEHSEGSEVLDGKIVLGKDFWERADVVIFWPAMKRKEYAGWWSWKASDEEEAFLGMMIGEQKVKFQKTV